MSTGEGWPAAGAGATSTAGGSPPPGWYPDPWGQAPNRFWDGASWTAHAAVGRPSARRRLPEGVPVYGPLIWVLAVLPVLGMAALWLSRVDASAMADFLRASEDAAQTGAQSPLVPPNPLTVFGPGYAVVMALSPVLYGVGAFLAYRDWNRLGRIGVVRPFHWAWAFLGAIVYVIGRSVIVRKVAAPRGFAPMWLTIAAHVAGLVSEWIWFAVFFASMAQQLPN